MGRKFWAPSALLLAMVVLAACGVNDYWACDTGQEHWGGGTIVDKSCVDARRSDREEARERKEEERRRAENEAAWAPKREKLRAWEEANFLTREQWLDMRAFVPYRGADAAMVFIEHEYNESDILSYYGELAYICRHVRNCTPSFKLALAPATARAPWGLLTAMDGSHRCSNGCAVAPGDYAMAAIVRMSLYSDQRRGDRNLAREDPDSSWVTINVASGAFDLDPAEGILRLEPRRAYAIVFSNPVERGKRRVPVLGRTEYEESWWLRYRFRLVSKHGGAEIPTTVRLDDSLNDIK